MLLEVARLVKMARAKAPDRLGSPGLPLGGKAPRVDFSERDNVHDGTAEGVLRGYGDSKKHYDVYQSYVPIGDMPSPVVVEDQDYAEHMAQYHGWRAKEQCPFADEDGEGCELAANGPDEGWREEMRSGSGSFPAPTVVVPLGGKPQLADGNHRVKHWSGGNYTHYPAWVLHERPAPRAKKR